LLYLSVMIDCISYSDISKIKEKPGCYSWFIDWTNIRHSDFEKDTNKRLDLINAIFKVYEPNPIFVNATRQLNERTQQFGDIYEGILDYRNNKTFNSTNRIANDFNLFLIFLNFTKCLIIPLYIGKSKNLNRRIKQHVEYLEDAKTLINSDLEKSDKEDLKNFSDRFSLIAKDCTSLGLRTNMLSVNLVYLEEENITEFESNLNYLYKPLFGIK